MNLFRQIVFQIVAKLFLSQNLLDCTKYSYFWAKHIKDILTVSRF